MRIFTLFFACLFSLKLLATDCIPNCTCDTHWTLEVRGAYYHLLNKSVKQIYTSHWLDYQVETAKRINPFIEVWGGVNWANRKGHTRQTYGSYNHSFRNKTQIFVLPISLGLKLIYPAFPCVDIYIGAGVCYSFLKIKNFCREHYSDWGISHSPFRKAIYKNDFGAIFKSGFQFAMSESTFLDFFADYYAQHFHLSHKRDRRNIFKHDVDCSGFKFGMGFGVYF